MQLKLSPKLPQDDVHISRIPRYTVGEPYMLQGTLRQSRTVTVIVSGNVR